LQSKTAFVPIAEGSSPVRILGGSKRLSFVLRTFLLSNV
jgi:hypothetical protein